MHMVPRATRFDLGVVLSKKLENLFNQASRHTMYAPASTTVGTNSSYQVPVASIAEDLDSVCVTRHMCSAHLLPHKAPDPGIMTCSP